MAAKLVARAATEPDEATRRVLALGWIDASADAAVPTSVLLERATQGGFGRSPRGSRPRATLGRARGRRRRRARRPGRRAPRFTGPAAPVPCGARARREPRPDAVGRLARAYASEGDAAVRRALVEALAARPAEDGREARRSVLELAARLDPDPVARWTASTALAVPPRGEPSRRPRKSKTWPGSASCPRRARRRPSTRPVSSLEATGLPFRSRSTTRDTPSFRRFLRERRSCGLRQACPRILLPHHEPAHPLAFPRPRCGGRGAHVRVGDQTADRDCPGARARRDPARGVAPPLRRRRQALARVAAEARLRREARGAASRGRRAGPRREPPPSRPTRRTTRPATRRGARWPAPRSVISRWRRDRPSRRCRSRRRISRGTSRPSRGPRCSGVPRWSRASTLPVVLGASRTIATSHSTWAVPSPAAGEALAAGDARATARRRPAR